MIPPSSSPTEKTRALLQLHIATLMFGCTGLFAQLIQLTATEITALRCVIAAGVLCLFLRWQRQPLHLRSQKDVFIAIALGVIVGLHWVTYFAAMQLAGVAIGMIAFFSYPIFTVLFEPLILRQRPLLADILLAIGVLFGISIMLPEFDLGNQAVLGAISGLVSALLFTGRNLLLKYQFRHYSGAHTMFYQTLVCAVMLIGFVPAQQYVMSASQWGLLILLGIGFTALPHALVASSLRILPAKSMSLISCLQPMYGVLFAMLVLGEYPSWQVWLGGSMVVSAALYETHLSQQASSKRN